MIKATPEAAKTAAGMIAGPVHTRRLGKRRKPAAQEENRGQTGDRNHAGILAHEEHGEFKAGIFGMIAGHEFRFGFGKVERQRDWFPRWRQ